MIRIIRCICMIRYVYRGAYFYIISYATFTISHWLHWLYIIDWICIIYRYILYKYHFSSHSISHLSAPWNGEETASRAGQYHRVHFVTFSQFVSFLKIRCLDRSHDPPTASMWDFPPYKCFPVQGWLAFAKEFGEELAMGNLSPCSKTWISQVSASVWCASWAWISIIIPSIHVNNNWQGRSTSRLWPNSSHSHNPHPHCCEICPWLYTCIFT